MYSDYLPEPQTHVCAAVNPETGSSAVWWEWKAGENEVKMNIFSTFFKSWSAEQYFFCCFPKDLKNTVKHITLKSLRCWDLVTVEDIRNDLRHFLSQTIRHPLVTFFVFLLMWIFMFTFKDESPAHCQLWVSAVGNLYPRINKKKKCDFISVLLHEIEMLLQ